MQEQDLEIAELLKKAEEADITPLEDGLTVPDEIARGEKRKAKLQAARVEMEARAVIRAAAERATYEEKKAEREAQREQGKKPRGSEPKEPDDQPGTKDEMNFTDPESRIMPCGGKTNFEQAYNAQAGVEQWSFHGRKTFRENSKTARTFFYI